MEKSEINVLKLEEFSTTELKEIETINGDHKVSRKTREVMDMNSVLEERNGKKKRKAI